MIYLDNAATSQFLQRRDEVIINTMSNAMRTYWKNPSSLYAQEVRNEIEECRKNIDDFRKNKYQILFSQVVHQSLIVWL